MLLLWFALPGLGFSQTNSVVLDDGFTIGPGNRGAITSFDRSASVNSRSEVVAKTTEYIDDDLRKTYFTYGRVVAAPAAPQRALKIKFPRNEKQVINGADEIETLIAPASPSRFNDLGRRFYNVLLPKGPVNFVQGITEISPLHVRVQTLKTEKYQYEVDMRLALSSFDSQLIMDILMRNADRDRSSDWLAVVNLLSEAGRYYEARKMLVASIKQFPDLENLSSELKRYDQLMADKLFEAAEEAKKAGQHSYAKSILEIINKPVLSLETQLKVDRRLKAIETEATEQKELLAWLREDISKLAEGDTKSQFLALADEIDKHLTADTVSRLSDYRRRRTDTTLKPEQLSSLGISGWIFGPSQGEDNSAVVVSGIKARELIRKIISNEAKNDQLVEELSRLEAGNPKLVAKILEFMPPPLTTPAEAQFAKEIASETDKPATQVRIPGRFVLEVPQVGRKRGTTVRYMVQLPPEYNPFRRYPCVVTLPSSISSIEDQVDWWCGPFAPNSQDQRCTGKATERGYIVLSPEWNEPKQPSYNFTENEQSAVLGPLRDAMRRFSIDTDRVYISGHFMGATAAWDLAWSHPDIWAGSVMVGARASKYIIQYWENALYVPSYFVAGSLDGSVDQNASTWDKLMDRKQFDALITVYEGRGIDHFQEELPRILDWLSYPRRVRKPFLDEAKREFKTVTSRAGDRFFWWFETEGLFTDKQTNPLLYKAGSEYAVESSVIASSNAIRFSSLPAKNYSVWLSPEFVDFSRILTIKDKRVEPKPNLRDMLFDVRTRADRQHPFWMRYDSVR